MQSKCLEISLLLVRDALTVGSLPNYHVVHRRLEHLILQQRHRLLVSLLRHYDLTSEPFDEFNAVEVS